MRLSSQMFASPFVDACSLNCIECSEILLVSFKCVPISIGYTKNRLFLFPFLSINSSSVRRTASQRRQDS